jgi:hypothetical protein
LRLGAWWRNGLRRLIEFIDEDGGGPGYDCEKLNTATGLLCGWLES